MHGRAFSLSRRGWLAGSALALGAGCALVRSSRGAPAFTPSRETHAFSLSVDPRGPGMPVNRRILGSNVGWVFGGDGMLDGAGEFDLRMLAMARRLAPTVLRYPGGTFSDVFHWEAPSNEHVYTRRRQPTLMDTQRFLELCEALGAAALITVNVVTGSAEEAARWVAAVNVKGMRSRLTGRALAPVRYWEIGNEPYLREEARADIDLHPQEFARRANRFIQAMRAVDPGIEIGLPLTSDTRGGVPVTPYPGFARQVLGKVEERFDYACLHNAYMPFGFRRGMAPQALYWGAAAGALTVQSDLAAMARLLAELRPGRALPLAVTEYSPIFSLGRGASDHWIASPAGALYLADLLRVFAQTPELALATHWSLSGNWLFGAIHPQGHARPACQVLTLMGEALQGQRLDARMDCSSRRVAGIGQVDAVEAMPLASALATRSGAAGAGTLRILLINKDPQRAALGRLQLNGMRPGRARMSLLAASDPFEAGDGPGVLPRSESTLVPDADGSLALHIPRHGIALITFDQHDARP